MIACLLIPGFELRAALRSRPRLAVVPAALAPEPGREQLVGPVEPGVVVFETRGVERLYGGVEAALTRALASVGPAWDPRAGAGQRRFVALAAASVARPGQAVIVEGEAEQAFLE